MKNKIITGILTILLLVSIGGWIVSINNSDELKETLIQKQDEVSIRSTEIAKLETVIAEKDNESVAHKTVIKEQEDRLNKLEKENKKQKKEIKNLKESHKKEVKKLKEKQEKELEKLKQELSLSKQTIEELKQQKTASVQEVEEVEEVKTVAKSEDNTVNFEEEKKGSDVGGRSLTVEASAYIATCTEGCTGVTASGYDVNNTLYYNGMRVIATDTSVIPMYSIVKIEGMSGEFIALDTGGAIDGHKIDVLVDSTQKALDFGRKNVEVTVIREGA